MIRFRLLLGVGLSILVPCSAAVAQEPAPEPSTLEQAFERENFSPYANRSFPTEVFWGDTHLHTSLSMDAGAFGSRLTPEDAYRFARGEQVTSSTGTAAKLSRPLDFLVIADHSDNMGLFTMLNEADPLITKSEIGAELSRKVRAGGREGVETWRGQAIASRERTASYPPWAAPWTSRRRAT